MIPWNGTSGDLPLPTSFVNYKIFNDSNDFYLFLQMNDGHNLLQGGGDWTNVIIPGNAQNSGFNHKMTYEVSSLLTDAEYECLVQARNQFGWSEASRIFHFYTGKTGKGKL